MNRFIKIGGVLINHDSILMVGSPKELKNAVTVKVDFQEEDIGIFCDSEEEAKKIFHKAVSDLTGD